jgi:fucose 4-O-acetylase-like acetyltransferase
VTVFSYVRNIPGIVSAQLTALGRSSLLVYVVHLVVVYGSVLNPGLMQRVGQSLSPPEAVAAAFGVLASMVLMARGWLYLRSHHTVPSRIVQAGLATGLVYMFLTRPY